MERRMATMAVVAIATVLGVAGLASLVTAAARPAERVTVMLEWSPNTNHTGLYVALDKGWYRDQGLDVQIVEPGEGVSVESVVGAGRADFGFSAQEFMTYARLQGVPVVSVAAVLQHNTSGFASMAGARIRRPKDFEGKRYGGFGLPIERAVLSSLMRCDGGDPEKLQLVSIGVGDLLSHLERGNVDLAWIFYGWQGIEAKLRGLDIDVVMMDRYAGCVPDYYTPVIITSESLIRQRPELVRRFVEATARGYAWSIEHPDEAAGILVRRVPELDPRLVRESQRWLSPRYRAEAPRWGEQKLEVWQRLADWLLEHGLVKGRLDAASAFTNRFLPAPR
ncbi:MAG: ABC transporter substrate-binding protein [Limnochordaceae bacterium]|nr:ABC transporter substrate-binding protein [Limnochordaceae bacterium]